METKNYCETPATVYYSVRYHMQEDLDLCEHCYEHFKSRIVFGWFSVYYSRLICDAV
jgi:hypothetical protein